MMLLIKIRSYFLKYWYRRPSGTLRYMFPMVLGLAVFLGASTITSKSSSYIKIVPTETIVKADERFALDVFAFAHVPVNAVDVTISFSPEAVEVLSIDTGDSVVTLWTEEPKVENNTVVMRGGTYRRGFSGEHKLATINLRAKNSGQAEFSVDQVQLLAGDGRGTSVSIDQGPENKLSLYIYNQNEDPANIKATVAMHIVTDIDGDGKVTFRDISTFMLAWPKRDVIYDFNNDGRMTFRDFSIILADSFFGTRR